MIVKVWLSGDWGGERSAGAGPGRASVSVVCLVWELDKPLLGTGQRSSGGMGSHRHSFILGRTLQQGKGARGDRGSLQGRAGERGEARVWESREEMVLWIVKAAGGR